MALVKGNTYANISRGTIGGPPYSVTQSHIQDSGSDGLLVALIAYSTSYSISAVKYNGIALTQAGSTYSSPGSLYYSVWYLLNPPTGANNFVVEMSNVTTIALLIQSFTGAAQSLTNILHNDAANTPHSQSITIDANSMILAFSGSLYQYDNAAALTIDGTAYGELGTELHGAISSAQFQAQTRPANLTSGSKTIIADTIADSYQATNGRLEIKEAAVTRKRIHIT
jgi:hypothetical protein